MNGWFLVVLLERRPILAKKKLYSGAPVRVTRLGSTEGWRIKARYLRARSERARGTIVGPAFGHRGTVLLVEHEQGVVGAYHVDELTPA